MKRIFSRLLLLYGCTTWTLTKRLQKKLDGNYTRMLRAIFNRSWQQHPTRHRLYGHLPPITKTIQARRTRHAGHCWRSKDEIVNDVFLWTPAYGQWKTGRPARTYIQQLCDDTGCNPEDLPEGMNDRETWRERGSGISVLAARHDDDDVIVNYLKPHTCVQINNQKYLKSYIPERMNNNVISNDDSLSRESEWQQVSSFHQGSHKYFSRS